MGMKAKRQQRQARLTLKHNQAIHLSNMQAPGRGKHGTQQFDGRSKAAETAQGK